MADNLLSLASQLKDKITEKKTTINSNNSQIIQQITQINLVAEEILGKVGNLNTGAQTLQQNIDAQARQIADLTRELEETRQQHETKQNQINEINTSLAEAQGRGTEADAFRQHLDELHSEAEVTRARINTLTKEIADSSTIIQELINSVDAQEIQQNQTELNTLTTELSQHIDEINAALPAGGPPAMEAQGLPPNEGVVESGAGLPPQPNEGVVESGAGLPPQPNEGVESGAGLLEAPPGMEDQSNEEIEPEQEPEEEPRVEENLTAATSSTAAQTRKNRPAAQNSTAKRGSSSAMVGNKMVPSETYVPSQKEMELMKTPKSGLSKKDFRNREQAFERSSRSEWLKNHPEVLSNRGGKRTRKHRKGNKSRYSRKRAKK